MISTPLFWFDLAPEEERHCVVEAPADADARALVEAANAGTLQPGWRWINTHEFRHGPKREIRLLVVRPRRKPHGQA